jgi:hypothetical protein
VQKYRGHKHGRSSPSPFPSLFPSTSKTRNNNKCLGQVARSQAERLRGVAARRRACRAPVAPRLLPYVLRYLLLLFLNLPPAPLPQPPLPVSAPPVSFWASVYSANNKCLCLCVNISVRRAAKSDASLARFFPRLHVFPFSFLVLLFLWVESIQEAALSIESTEEEGAQKKQQRMRVRCCGESLTEVVSACLGTSSGQRWADIVTPWS